MDGVDVIATTINMISLENGGHLKLSSSGHADLMLLEGKGSHANEIRYSTSDNISGHANHLEEREGDDFSCTEAKGVTITHAESKLLAVSKELGEKNPNQEDNSKPVKTQGKPGRPSSSATENPTNSKLAAATWLRKNVFGKEEMPTSSILNGLNSKSKQPLANKSNGRQVVECYASVDAAISQTSQKVRAAPTTTSALLPEVSKEQRKNLKPLKQNALDKAEEHPQSLLNANPRRLGTTPSYNFSFKCNERAEKRKEFFSKIEEKITAKEVEISNLQAKTKESQEAEIKLLRKSLTFKATPMPSFYQEPAPPKVELKKIPPTRAKSPKFSRQKSSSEKEKPTDIERNQSHGCRSTRLSLNDRVSQNGLATDSPLHSKKPHRKSLPILLSQETEIPSPAQLPENHKLDKEEEPIEHEPLAQQPENQKLDIEEETIEYEPPSQQPENQKSDEEVETIEYEPPSQQPQNQKLDKEEEPIIEHEPVSEPAGSTDNEEKPTENEFS